jgi:hypothetical protein
MALKLSMMSGFFQNALLHSDRRTSDDLTKDKHLLTRENEALIKDIQLLIIENEALTKENQALIKENEALVKEYEALVKEYEALVKENEALVKENQALTEEKQLLTQLLLSKDIIHRQEIENLEVAIRNCQDLPNEKNSFTGVEVEAIVQPN